MKTKLMGLGILAAVIVAAVVYVWVSDSREVTEISGYVGGEKIGLLEDEEVQEILRDQYRLEMDYAKAGSIEMVTADASGRDYLFPSSQTALELYERLFGSPVKSEIVFNTPIVNTRSSVWLRHFWIPGSHRSRTAFIMWIWRCLQRRWKTGPAGRILGFLSSMET